jgi:hypothetical protein
MRNWKVLDFGPMTADPEINHNTIEFTCMNCMKDALLPVIGVVIAQLESGLVFDNLGRHAVPKQIQCPHCRKRMEWEV